MTTRTTATGCRVQRYHPALNVGDMLTVNAQRQEAVEVHMRQSAADSACALHCVAMALIVLNMVKRSAVVAMTHRKYGVAADLYELLGHTWLQGVFATEVVEALEAMELPMRVRWADGFDADTDAFAIDSLKRCQLTMLAYEASGSDRHRHFVLGVGCGGVMHGRDLAIDSLLVLDPSIDALPFSCCNAILTMDEMIQASKRRKSIQWSYASFGACEPVRLMSAISLVPRERSLIDRVLK